MNIFRLVLAFMASVWSFSLLAQTITPIPLNRHFFPIQTTDSLHHQYNQINSYNADSVLIERIFDLENKLVRISRTSPKDSVYHEKILEFFMPDGKLSEKVIANLANTKFISTHYLDGAQVAQVLYRGENKYSISRQLIDENREWLYNDFDPNPVETKKVFYDYILERVTFSTSQMPRDRQLAVIAVYVDEKGIPGSIIWANPLGCEPKHAERYLKAVKTWKYGYTPARDIYGNPVGKWRLFHFHLPRLVRGPEPVLTFFP